MSSKVKTTATIEARIGVQSTLHRDDWGARDKWVFFSRGLIFLALLNLIPQPIHAANQPPTQPAAREAKVLAPIRPRSICPTELEPLTQGLLRDLPQYINRLSHQRGGSQSGKYAIVASRPNLEPLPVVTNISDPARGGLHQVFFTVLERQYDTRQKIDYQNYYWLFLAHTRTAGWQLAILYTRRDSSTNLNQVISPLQDSTQEVPGLAVRQWLRDCRAGSVPFEPD
ncbi:MAG: hypothetical protein NW224_18900 [Leptolyngbyaceae cyanobacterium bins.302]|nr:hypothetical protein [Leptolyngbyaceae cyanobacterium bins.302]